MIKTSLFFLFASTLQAQEGSFAVPSAQELRLPEVAKTDLKKPWVAVGMSWFIPGLGHVYLEDYATAGEIFSTAFISVEAAGSSGIGGPFRYELLQTAQNTWFYGVYAAYRDARIRNGNFGYSSRMPTDRFIDLSLAPFRWSIIKKPEVWGGLLGSLALASAIGHLSIDPHWMSASSLFDFTPIVAFPIGIGEEAFFRGFLQSALAESLPPWGAIAAASAIFSAAHIPNALLMDKSGRFFYYTHALPLIGALGAYFGWVSYKNHSLQESVALHAWYDFTLMAVSALATPATSSNPRTFAISFSF